MRKVTLKELAVMPSFIVKVDQKQSLQVQTMVLSIGEGSWSNVEGYSKWKVRDSENIKYLCYNKDKKLAWLG